LDEGRVRAVARRVGAWVGVPRAGAWVEEQGRAVEPLPDRVPVELVAVRVPGNPPVAEEPAQVPGVQAPARAVPVPVLEVRALVVEVWNPLVVGERAAARGAQVRAPVPGVQVQGPAVQAPARAAPHPRGPGSAQGNLPALLSVPVLFGNPAEVWV
jgi:hypothetical protein